MVSRLTKLKGILRGAFLFVHSSFGFASLEQLKEWFFDDNDRELLSLHGIVCNEYEIEGWGFVAGERQCIFVKENARLVGQVDFI